MKRVLNSKGMSIIEIILAIGLVSIVMVQVLNLLVDLKGEQVLGESKTKDLSNRSIIMQQVENDFVNRRITEIDTCPLDGKISNTTIYTMKSCVKIVYDGEGSTPYFLITAKRDNDYDYFIYGYAETDSNVPTVYEAWRLETGVYPDNTCQFQLQYFDCKSGSNDLCDSRYFVLKYPVLLSKTMSNTTMNFDLEFVYYFRSNDTVPLYFYDHSHFWNGHSEDCKRLL